MFNVWDTAAKEYRGGDFPAFINNLVSFAV